MGRRLTGALILGCLVGGGCASTQLDDIGDGSPNRLVYTREE